MADDIELDNGEELDLDALFDNSEFTTDTEEDTGGDRDPVDSVLKSTKNVINEKVNMDGLMDTASGSISRVMPSKITNELDKINDIKDAISEPAMKQVKEIRTQADTLLGNTKDMFGVDDESFMGSMINKIRDAIKPDSEDSDREEKENVDEKIANDVSGILEGLMNKETQAEKQSTLEQSLSNATQEQLLTKMVAGISTTNDFNVSVANSYYRKSLELSFKQTLLQDSIFNLLKTNSDLQGKQLESIVKNTGLPDIIKMHNKDHLEKVFKDKALSYGMDMLGKNDIVKNVKENLGTMVEDGLGSVINGLGMGNQAMEAMQMAEDAGMSRTEILIDTLMTGSMDKIADGISKLGIDLLGKTEFGKDANSAFSDFKSDPVYALMDQKEAIESKGDLNMADKARIVILDKAIEAMGSSSVNDVKLTNSKPDDLTMFDERTKTAITNVIPTLLANIHKEIVGIRTGEMPTDNKIFDYDNNKFTTDKALKRELLHNISTNNKSLAKDLDSSNLFNIFEYEVKLTKDERKIVKERYIEHVSEGGTIAPSRLVQSSFLDNFDGKLKTKLIKNISKAASSNNSKDVANKDKFVDYSNSLKNSINQSTNNLNTTALRLNKLGAGDILNDIGLTGKDRNKIKAKDITKLNKRVMAKHITGNVSVDDFGKLTPDEVSAAKVIKNTLINNIQQLEDNSVTLKNKADSLELLDKLPLKQILKYEKYTKSNIRKLIFDLAKGRIDVEDDTDESFIGKFVPKAVKEFGKKITDSDTIINAKNGIADFGEDKLGIDKIESNGNQVEWSKDDLEGKDKNRVKVNKLFKERITKGNKSDTDININTGDGTDIEPLIDLLTINNTNTDNILEVMTTIKDSITIDEDKSILSKLLDTVNNIYDIFKEDEDESTDDDNDKSNIDRKTFNRRKSFMNNKKSYDLKVVGKDGKLVSVPNRRFMTGGGTGDIDPGDPAGIVDGGETVINHKDNEELIDVVNDIKENLGDKPDTDGNNLTESLKDTLGNIVTTLGKIPDSIKENSESYQFRKSIGGMGYMGYDDSIYSNDLLEGVTTILKNAFSTDNKDSVLSTVKDAFSFENKDSVLKDMKDAFDITNENSILSNMKTGMTSMFTSLDTKLGLTDKFNTGKEYATDKAKELDKKLGISDKVDTISKGYTTTVNNIMKRTKTGNDSTRIDEKLDKNIDKLDNKEWLSIKTYESISTMADGIKHMINPNDKDTKFNIFNNKKVKDNKEVSGIDKRKALRNSVNEQSKEEKSGISKLTDKVSDMLNIDNITIEPFEVKDKFDNASKEFKINLDKTSKEINDKGMFNYIKEKLSSEDIPDDDDAEAFYTRILNTIDPIGNLKKMLSAGGNFVRNMIGLHVAGITWAYNKISQGGKYIKDKVVDGYNNARKHVKDVAKNEIKDFLKSMIPAPIRQMIDSVSGVFDKFKHVLDNNMFGRMFKKLLPNMGNITKHLGGIVKDNLKVLKDTARESFTDKDGKTRINLLRSAKFLGKSFVRTAKVTGKGIDGKGGIRGVYGEAFKGVGEVGSTALRFGARFIGVEKMIPVYRRTFIVETAPIPEAVKAMYFKNKITFKEIPDNLSEKEAKAYLKHLKTYKKEKGSMGGKILNSLFKSAITVGDKVLDPMYTTVAKGATKGAKAFIDNELENGTVKDSVVSGVKGVFKSATSTGNVFGAAKDSVVNTYNNNKEAIHKNIKSVFKDTDSTSIKNKMEKMSDIPEDLKEKNVTAMEHIATSMNSILSFLKPKEAKFNDKDGDGKRDGNAEDRAEKLYGGDDKEIKKPGMIKKLMNKIPGNKSSFMGILMGVGLLMSKVKEFFSGGFLSGMGKVFKNVLWEPVKWLGGKLLDLGSGIVSGIWKGIQSLVMKIPGMKTISKIKDSAVDMFKNAKDSVVKKANKIGGWFSDKWSSAKKSVSKAIGWDKFKKYGSETVEKAKGLLRRIGPMVNGMKSTLFKKIGVKAGSEIFAKVASKLVPILGWPLLAYDSVKIAYDMIHNGTSLKSAVSKQLLTIDLFSDDEDSKTDTEEAIEIPSENNTKHTRSNRYNRPNVTHTQSNTRSRNNRHNYTNNNKQVNNITNQSILGEIKSPIPNKPKLLADLVRDEGLRLHTYKDSLGYDTIGVGHLLDKAKGGKPLKDIIGKDTDTITQPEAMKVLANDVNRTSKELYSKLPWLKNKPENVQTDLVNAGFNLGVKGLLGFKKSLKHIKDDDYQEASEELKNSRWYTQTGVRAQRIVENIRNTVAKHNIANNSNYTPNTVSNIIDSNNSKNISTRVEADKQQFVKNNILKKGSNKINIADIDTVKDNVLLNTLDKQTKQTSSIHSVTKGLQLDTTNILKESLSVQQDMLKVLTGIYKLNKEMVSKLDNKENTNNKPNSKAPKFTDNNIKHALNLKTGTF